MFANSTLTRWGLVMLLMLSYTFSYAQRRITGTVMAANNQPASGATVTVTGTQVATQTDPNGTFSISVPAGRNTLTVTYVGYEIQTVNVANQTNVTVTLRASSAALSEVVVTGYGTQRKKDLTGAVAVVDVGNMR